MGLLAAAAVAGEPQPGAAPPTLFAYDATKPLQLQDRVVEIREYATVHDISYLSTDGNTISAYLVSPRRRGSFAGVLFGHWGNGTRAEFLPEAELYARAGAVSLLPDYAWDRLGADRKSVDHFTDPQVDRSIFAQAVIDLRRGLDVLLRQPGVDPKRIAYVGHSYGAQWGVILAAVDRRVATVVLMGGVPQAADLFLHTNNPDLIGLRNSLPPGQLEKYVDTIGELDGMRFISRVTPIPVFLQFAKYEQYFDREAADRYIAVAREPKRIKWYDTDHELNDPQSLRDRVAWLTERVGLSHAVEP
jgi:dienelactone hydrolase